jgi:hypothetical protein
MGYLGNITLSTTGSGGSLPFDWLAVSISISGQAFGAAPIEYWTDMYIDVQLTQNTNQLTVYLAPVVSQTADFAQQFMDSPTAFSSPPAAATCPVGFNFLLTGGQTNSYYPASTAACMKLIWFGANVLGNLDPPDNLFPYLNSPDLVQNALDQIDNDGAAAFIGSTACPGASADEDTEEVKIVSVISPLQVHR